jgi:hypothetical protein
LTEARARRVIVLFLLGLTILVMARAASGARGATTETTPRSGVLRGEGVEAATSSNGSGAGFLSLRIEEAGDLLVGGTTAHRTLAVHGARPWAGDLEIAWDALIGRAPAASGRASASARSGAATRVVLSVPVPAVSAPQGLDLRVRVGDAGRTAGEAVFAFTVYPAASGRRIAERLARPSVALFDPEEAASPVLGSLGLPVRRVEEFQDLALFEGDLIIVGPGGFARGREGLGPILAARARGGARVLILDQPSLPATLSDDLRLWPSFSRSPDSRVALAPDHPIFAGLSADEGAGYLAAVPAGVRPLLPPTRGNFRVVAQVRVRRGPSWQEGVTLLEVPIGDGAVLAAQASLCAAYPRDPRARIVLVNALAYLLGDRPRMPRTYFYAAGPEALPRCLAHLAPRVPRVPESLREVDVLVVPGDWQARRARQSAGLPPLAAVSRFLREGGTVVLLNPQALALDYLHGVVGGTVYFEAADREAPPAGAVVSAPPVLQGIAPEDLDLIAVPGRPEMRVRSGVGADGVAPTLLIPGLARYRVGSGVLVALTLPEPDACPAPRLSSLLARLLTNLGVILDPGPPAAPEAVTRLDD